MKRHWRRIVICGAIVAGSVALTVSLSRYRFFQVLNVKAQDAQFVLRGKVPVSNIVLIGIDNATLDRFPELSSFWHRYYADAIRGAAEGGAKVFVLDETFVVPVTKYEPDNDAYLAQAFGEASATMPVISAFVPEAMGSQQDPRYAVPLNMMAAALGTAAMANLTADTDTDDFVRRQELIEAPKPGVPPESMTRSMALRAAEKFLGADIRFRGPDLYLGDRRIPASDRTVIINYAGPAGTIPRVPLYRFIEAARAHDLATLRNWVNGKAVLLGPDNYIGDRYNTPFYTFLTGGKNTTPGVEIHANTLRTLLTGDFLQPVPAWARILFLAATAAITVSVVALFSIARSAIWLAALFAAIQVGTHLSFLNGWLLPGSEGVLSMVTALIGGIVYRFATAEKKSSFLRGAVELFVGKQVARSLDTTQEISMVGERRMVTILFTDIRGFTAFCESKDPAYVVDVLNTYMSTMVAIIVKYGGHVNKFIGDGILAVFSDTDEGARPGDHAIRTARCAEEMVREVIGEFHTGAGFHSGEVVIGNVGSSDKLEFTVLGNTVNLASRLESLNKDQQTKLLMSEETREMIGAAIDTVYLGAVPVKGKTEKMKLYTVTSLLDDKRLAELTASHEREAVA